MLWTTQSVDHALVRHRNVQESPLVLAGLMNSYQRISRTVCGQAQGNTSLKHTITIFWGMTPYSAVHVNCRFCETKYFNLCGSSLTLMAADPSETSAHICHSTQPYIPGDSYAPLHRRNENYNPCIIDANLFPNIDIDLWDKITRKTGENIRLQFHLETYGKKETSDLLMQNVVTAKLKNFKNKI